MNFVGKTAEYNPKFKANTNDKANCPKCKNELSERDKAGGRWYCNNCEHWIIIQPPYHENGMLGHDYFLFIDKNKNLLKYPGGFLNVHCPICNRRMFVEKIYLNPTGKHVEPDKSSLSFGYVCEDWKNCGYTQVLRVVIPTKEIDSLKSK